jgi:DNA-binding NarL/FixJ family response regulator
VDAGLAAVEVGGPGAQSALIMAELISLAAHAVMAAPEGSEGAARARMARRLARMRQFMHPGQGRPVFGIQVLRAYRLEIAAALARDADVLIARRWSLAAEAWAELGNLPAAHHARMESASKWLARADRRAAHAALAAAWRCAQDIESTTPREETISFASTHGIALHGHARDHPADGWGTLTAREREVLVLIASGLTNRQIATRLFITEKTAGIHVSNILGKLGVARRTEAAMVAMRAGLAPPSVSDLRSRLRQRGSAHRSAGI